MNEIEILKVIGNHPNVVKLIEFYEDQQYFCLVLEYVPGKDLFNFISQNKLDERHVQYLFK
jgi:serine/threonine protein kinase